MRMKVMAVLVAGCCQFSHNARAASCDGLPDAATFKDALTTARHAGNGGIGNDMWGVLVDRSGTVCSVAYTGKTVDAQWPGSRLIAANKAFTANAFSLKNNALSTANLYGGTQPGGFLYGIQFSHPVDTSIAYKGPMSSYGTDKDPMLGEVVGGVIVFGGGLALYNDKGEIIGGVGVSGDTSCADHNIAWRTRSAMKLDYVPGGMSPGKDDQIIYDVSGARSKSGFGQPDCGLKEKDAVKSLPPVEKLAAKAAQ